MPPQLAPGLQRARMARTGFGDAKTVYAGMGAIHGAGTDGINRSRSA
jgi:hypothetical protein